MPFLLLQLPYSPRAPEGVGLDTSPPPNPSPCLVPYLEQCPCLGVPTPNTRQPLAFPKTYDFSLLSPRPWPLVASGLCPPPLPGPSLPAPTWALVELAGLGDVPLAEPGPLADGRFHPIDLVLGNNGVQEDAPEEEKPDLGESLMEGRVACLCAPRSRPCQSPDIPP